MPFLLRQARHLAVGLFFAAAPAAAIPAPPPAIGSAEALCAALGTRIGGFDTSACVGAGLRVAGHSVGNRPLVQRDYAETRHGARRVLLIGAIHGDEPAATKLVFDWMRRIEAAPERPVRWRVAPCVNPDGVLADKPTRVNAHGVDLNRNFPTADWPTRALAYWTSHTKRDPRRYPGSGANSEPETRWLVEQIREFQPDAIVSVHAPYGVLDYDGPKDPPKRLGFLQLQPLGVYPGSLGGYAGLNLRTPVITLELPESFRAPNDVQSLQLWKDLVGWINRKLPPEGGSVVGR